MSGDDEPDWLDDIKEALDTEPDLEPTAPDRAFEIWMQQQQDSAESTLQSYRYRVRPFIRWLQQNGIDNLNDVTTRDIKEFQAERRGDRQRNTLNNQWGTIKQFLQYCYELNAVTEDVILAVDVPDLSKDDRVNTEKLIADRAQDILENLERFRYASREHVLFLLLWRTTMRIGAIYSLDLDDIYLDEDDRDRLRQELLSQGFATHVVDGILEDVELPIIYPRHQPDTETPLKNGGDGERVINIADWVGDTIQDYIDVNRHDIEDGNGRRPLLTSKKGDGRLSKSAMRNWVYILTQPCEFGAPCPHDRDPETCDAREHGYGSLCPSSRSPHKIRTGAITHHRDQGWSIADIADRANTSEELIQGVYDQPEELIRGAHRRSNLDKLDES
jgi:site-specific recombinase XerD